MAPCDDGHDGVIEGHGHNRLGKFQKVALEERGHQVHIRTCLGTGCLLAWRGVVVIVRRRKEGGSEASIKLFSQLH